LKMLAAAVAFQAVKMTTAVVVAATVQAAG
jgi:hypothetical protein